MLLLSAEWKQSASLKVLCNVIPMGQLLVCPKAHWSRRKGFCGFHYVLQLGMNRDRKNFAFFMFTDEELSVYTNANCFWRSCLCMPFLIHIVPSQKCSVLYSNHVTYSFSVYHLPKLWSLLQVTVSYCVVLQLTSLWAVWKRCLVKLNSD